MAWTVTKRITIFGDQAISLINLLPDAAESAVDTGLSRVDGFAIGINSMTTTASYHVKKNVGSTGTALVGYLGCSGFTSGDVVDVIVWGKR
jgi:hypothetical protein